MAKQLFVDPNEVRKSSEIAFSNIPVNTYNKTLEEELENYSREDLVRIYRDMVIIRQFEEMLLSIKTTGEYNGISYNYPGPAHLSIGQEASAVGQAYLLDQDDLIFGSHRSHGEILAKGLSVIEKMDAAELEKVMEEYLGGSILEAVRNITDGETDTKELANLFLLYGTLAEIFARETGFQKGLGGSMHAFFTPFGVYPNNAIVGGSAAIALGAAMYKKVNRKKGIVVANIGDASIACGPVWEGLVFATMDQFTHLWEGDMKGGLPLIINIMNNQYGMGGQTSGETMGYGVAARIGAGLNADQMHAERVDRYNPLAVIDAYRRKKQILQEKRGPVLLDVLTYRYSGHSPSDASSYRLKEEVEAWENQDSIVWFGNELVKAGIAQKEELEAIRSNTAHLITTTLKLAIDDEVSP